MREESEPEHTGVSSRFRGPQRVVQLRVDGLLMPPAGMPIVTLNKQGGGPGTLGTVPCAARVLEREHLLAVPCLVVFCVLVPLAAVASLFHVDEAWRHAEIFHFVVLAFMAAAPTPGLYVLARMAAMRAQKDDDANNSAGDITVPTEVRRGWLIVCFVVLAQYVLVASAAGEQAAHAPVLGAVRVGWAVVGLTIALPFAAVVLVLANRGPALLMHEADLRGLCVAVCALAACVHV